MRVGATPGKLGLAGVLLLALAAVLLWLLPSNTYIFLPDRAHPVDPLITVQGGHKIRGPRGIYFVDIFVRKATLIERLFPSIHEGAQLVPASSVLPKGVSETARQNADKREMTRSQEVATIRRRSAGPRTPPLRGSCNRRTS